MSTDLLKNLPDLQTPRLLLRKLRMEDAADMFEYAQDAEIGASGLWLPYTELQQSADDIAETIRAYEACKALDWAVEHRADRKMIGRINLGHYHRGDQRADLGYAYNRRYWGQGYATEAARAVIDFAFGSLGLNRVGAVVLPDNIDYGLDSVGLPARGGAAAVHPDSWSSGRPAVFFAPAGGVATITAKDAN